MNKSYRYPAIFEHTDEDVFVVEFPDLPGCLTEGDSLEEAYEYAKEAMRGWLGAYLEDYEAPVATSLIDAMKLKTGDSAVLFVEVDVRDLQTKSVRASVTLPAWMKAAAERKGINISQTLQRALNIELEKVG